MANTIQIRRSLTTAVPTGLEDGEFAYSYASDKLFIGHESDPTQPPIQLLPQTVTADPDVLKNDSIIDGGTF